MISRKTLLQIMLGALAVTAAFGVLGALLSSYSTIWRIMWTCFSTSVAAGLLLPLSLMADREKLRPAGLFGMAAILAMYALVLALIWPFLELIRTGWSEEELFITLLCLIMVTPFGMTFCGFLRSKSSILAGLVGLPVIGLAFLSMMIATWGPWDWYSDERFWVTGWTIGGFGLLAVMCLIGFNTHRRWWPFAGVAAAAIAATMLIVQVWFEPGGGPEVFTVITSIACAIAHANLILLCPPKPIIRVLQFLTIGSAVGTAALIDLVVIFFADFDPIDNIAMRLAAALAILATCGSLALVVLSAIFRPVKIEAGISEFVQITIFCPRCRSKHTLPLGESQCPTCRLQFNLRVQDPRCPQCDYLLIGLTGDTCPECGHPIGASEAVAPAPPTAPVAPVAPVEPVTPSAE